MRRWGEREKGRGGEKREWEKEKENGRMGEWEKGENG